MQEPGLVDFPSWLGCYMCNLNKLIDLAEFAFSQLSEGSNGNVQLFGLMEE